MNEKDIIYLRHILEVIQRIEQSVEKVSEDEFKGNLDLVDATVRRIEIIGEATKNLSDPFKEQHPEVPWKKIAGMRDVLIHAYFSVDLQAIWKVIEKDLPELKKSIQRFLS